MEPTPRFSIDEMYNLAIDGYIYELEAFINISNSEFFEDILAVFSNYKTFLKSGRNKFFGTGVAHVLKNRSNLIDGNVYSKLSNKVFTCANIAACCDFFNSWTIPIGELEIKQVPDYLQYAVYQAGLITKEKIARIMCLKLNSGDATRVIQTLQLLGLVNVDSNTCQQLSLGASTGTRDRQAIHQVPHIEKINQNTQYSISFGVVTGTPKHIVLIDNDPNLKSHYERININEKGKALAMNNDLYCGLEEMERLVAESKVSKRNLVVAYRLEPQAFHDIRLFFQRVGKTIQHNADFIATIGSGDDDNAFLHRINVIDEMEKTLREKGLKPIRIKWYKGETLEEQQKSPLFGLGPHATYEIIYCKLNRKNLL